MSERKKRSPSLPARVEADYFGEIYVWLKRHRRRVANRIGKKGAIWLTVAAEMNEAGVRSQAGGPVNRHLLCKTWIRLSADLAAEAEAKRRVPTKQPRSYRPNVEPPSRPPPNYDTIRYPSHMTAEPRYRHPPNQAEGAAPADQGASSPTSRSLSEMTPAERMADLDRTMREMDGYQPQIQRRGKIV